MEDYHGAILKLDPTHSHSPLPAVFLIHEMSVRGHWPYKPDRPLELFDPTIRVLHHVIDDEAELADVEEAGDGAYTPTLLFTTPFWDTKFLEQFKESSRSLNSWKILDGPDEWNGTAQNNIDKFLAKEDDESALA